MEQISYKQKYSSSVKEQRFGITNIVLMFLQFHSLLIAHSIHFVASGKTLSLHQPLFPENFVMLINMVDICVSKTRGREWTTRVLLPPFGLVIVMRNDDNSHHIQNSHHI